MREKYLYIGLVTSLVNGLIIYAFSLELSSNQYYSSTMFSTLYATCLCFLGHGIGGVLVAKYFKVVTDKDINKLIGLWLITIVVSAIAVFRLFPVAMNYIHNTPLVLPSTRAMMKILVGGAVELPVFLVGGMVYAALLSFVRRILSECLPKVVGATTLGTAAGYVLGLFVPMWPGINATFCMALGILFTVFVWRKKAVLIVVLTGLFFLLAFVNVDGCIEQIRHKDNSVYAKYIKGFVVDYGWSRFQKSEFISSPDKERLYLTLNGNMQVMITQNEGQVKNVGYDMIYQKSLVDNKRVLVIGSGMGRGVRLAVKNGAAHVDCVDIEPILEEKYDVYKKYCDDIYSDSRVNFYIMDGRKALKYLNKEKYDLIVFEGVINRAAVYALNVTTEGYIYTAEAIRDSLNILSDDGLFVSYMIDADKSVHSFSQEYGLVKFGYKAKYCYGLVDDRNTKIRYYIAVAGVSKNQQKVDYLKDYMSNVGNNNIGNKISISNISVKDIEDSEKVGIMPSITDDRPFPHIVSPKAVSFELIYTGVFVILSGCLLFFGIRKKDITRKYVQFSFLGISMMMIELYIVNKLNFYLNDSIMSLSVGTAVFLLAFAVGNAKSMECNFAKKKFMILFIICNLLFTLFFNLGFSEATLLWPWVIRLLLVIVIIAPLAALCGVFFPRLLLTIVDADAVEKSMAYIMLLDAFGVTAGFFLFNYIGCLWGFSYTLPVILGLYLFEAHMCFGGS